MICTRTAALLLAAAAGASAELQLIGLSPSHGSPKGGEPITLMFAGVEPVDWSGFDSTFMLHWNTGPTSGRFQHTVRPDSAPPSGFCNATGTTVAANPDFKGPYMLKAASEAWADGNYVIRSAVCVNGPASCTFTYDAAEADSGAVAEAPANRLRGVAA